MSYLVLARKYRPKTFAELVGQGHVVQALTNALRSGRLHHAYLFTGTRGVGKTTVSRILAKSLNCVGPDGTGGVTDAPCGVCDPCRDIDRGRFVDYTELDAASNRGVDEVQSLLEQAVYKPVQGRFKVFMIDEVHMLSGHAFNAMLKTLEEPPEYLKFVLATTDPQKVPVTVLSRCLQFNLAPMAPQTVREHLADVLASEQVEAEPAALRLIARAARGSMRDALSLTDQAIAFGGGQLQEAPVRQMLGSVDRTHVLRLIEALAASDARSVIATIDTLRTHGFSAAATLEDMSLLLQRMAVLQVVPALPEVRGSATDSDDDQESQTDPEAADAIRLALSMPADETQLLYSICLHGRAELGLAPDEYTGLTMVLLRLLAFKPASGATAGPDVPAAAQRAQKKTVAESAAGALPALSVATVAPERASARATDALGAPSVAVADEVGTAGARSDPCRSEDPDANVSHRLGADEPTDADVVAADKANAGTPQSGTGATADRMSAQCVADKSLPGVPTERTSPAAPSTAPALTPESIGASAPRLGPPSTPLAAVPAGDSATDASARARAEQPLASAGSPKHAASSTSGAHFDGPIKAEPTQVGNQPLQAVAARANDLATADPDTGAATVPGTPAEPADGTRTGAGVEIPALAPTTGEVDDLGDFWHLTVQQLAASGTITALVRELALQSQLIARDDQHWTLHVASSSLDQPISRERLTQALVTDGHAVASLRVEIAAVSDSPARRIAAAAEQAQREALARIEGDPFVQSMIRDYGARIVPGSVRAAAPQRAG
ncbi:MAG: DNA polymerase III subunit gamma/tau [Burkholderiaceae bacterium]